jgi:hypothetical protein
VIAPPRCPLGIDGDEDGHRSWLRPDSRPAGATSDPRLPEATLPVPRRISLEALGQPLVRNGGGG